MVLWVLVVCAGVLFGWVCFCGLLGYYVFMISSSEPRMQGILLREVAFRCDLGVLLGVGDHYVKKLVAPSSRPHDKWFRECGFPAPFYVSPAGISVWFVSDLEDWCRSVRLKATSLRMKRFGAFLDRPELIERVLGI